MAQELINGLRIYYFQYLVRVVSMNEKKIFSSSIRRLTNPHKHHFFGYYGINPWDYSGEKHLALETDFHTYPPKNTDVANVGLVDRLTGVFNAYATTSAFNLQQGSMMHWIGDEFTYNDWDNGKLVSRIINTKTRESRTIQGAIAAISPTEPLGIGLNYQRMALCRSVVGYASEIDPSGISDLPEDDGLFLLNLVSGNSELILSITDVIAHVDEKRFSGKRTWFNHVHFNIDGTRILFFCRIRLETGFLTSLWTVNPDGSDLECQIPFGYRISHFDWKSTTEILVSSDIVDEMGFVEFTDGNKDFTPLGRGVLPNDGHASYSPDRQYIVCDTYPRGVERYAELMIYDISENGKILLGEFQHDEQFSGDIRCDLHPRWSIDGKTITFDSVHENSRQIYCIDL